MLETENMLCRRDFCLGGDLAVPLVLVPPLLWARSSFFAAIFPGWLLVAWPGLWLGVVGCVRCAWWWR